MTRPAYVVDTGHSAELSDHELAAIALTGRAFDDLAEEPDLYSVSDGEPVVAA